jgi:FkbM family methyltransferase
VAFVLMSSNHGTMIVNKNDHYQSPGRAGIGVGFQLLSTSSFDQQEVDFVLMLLDRRRQHFGAGVVALDCGANIGVHTIEWARLMTSWGHVYAFEAQEKVFYALAGNVAINNCFNVSARNCAVGAQCAIMQIPEPDYFVASSFGSLELKQNPKNEFIGQQIDYSRTHDVALITIDSLNLKRVDFIKIDVEGMELEVLQGAQQTIAHQHPMMVIEAIKSDGRAIAAFLEQHDYATFPMAINILAVHRQDPILSSVHFQDNKLWLS